MSTTRNFTRIGDIFFFLQVPKFYEDGLGVVGDVFFPILLKNKDCEEI
jgi:hypothetical protein